MNTDKRKSVNLGNSSNINKKRKAEDISQTSKQNREELVSIKKKRHNDGGQNSQQREKTLLSTSIERDDEMFTFKKTINRTHINAKRLYLPAPFSRSMLKASLKKNWNVISPPTDDPVEDFTFKLLPSFGREKELKLGGDWRKFCRAYHLKKGTEIRMTIKSIEERTLKVELKLPTAKT
ncbi:hypothetical protein PIB30_033054 [Stylosanthes scabra]|uniref:TF-B3 domain-containing protein n=1 Tax=Stylosanthes scabra TaxID=79078 RepID=A0ABU6YEB6_9FABA|nr:hypothetical protein [Stylosanthes scabra]